jgi:hypothetical protein
LLHRSLEPLRRSRAAGTFQTLRGRSTARAGGPAPIDTGATSVTCTGPAAARSMIASRTSSDSMVLFATTSSFMVRGMVPSIP